MLDRRIAYYTKKVAEYGDRSMKRKPGRSERLLKYKILLHKKIDRSLKRS